MTTLTLLSPHCASLPSVLSVCLSVHSFVVSGARPPAAPVAVAARKHAAVCFHSLAACSRAHTPSCSRNAQPSVTVRAAAAAPRAFSSAAEGEKDHDEEGEEEEEEEEEGEEEGGDDAMGETKKPKKRPPTAARAPLGSARPTDQRHLRSIVHLGQSARSTQMESGVCDPGALLRPSHALLCDLRWTAHRRGRCGCGSQQRVAAAAHARGPCRRHSRYRCRCHCHCRAPRGRGC